MAKKREDDNNTGTVLTGLLILAAGVAGFGWWRRRVERAHGGICKRVEESVYRGFAYRIEECPLGESRGYLGVLVAQQVGTVTIHEDEGAMLETIDDARKYVSKLIDDKLSPRLQAVFVGANS